jgi:hypothetical protein
MNVTVSLELWTLFSQALKMAEIVNFRKARKAKARSEQETRAAENRAQFGRTKAEKQLGQAQKELTARTLDAHRRDDSHE